ncbi:845_t:CDS:2, partial [Entrophospora sp. SA101]
SKTKTIKTYGKDKRERVVNIWEKDLRSKQQQHYQKSQEEKPQPQLHYPESLLKLLNLCGQNAIYTFEEFLGKDCIHNAVKIGEASFSEVFTSYVSKFTSNKMKSVLKIIPFGRGKEILINGEEQSSIKNILQEIIITLKLCGRNEIASSSSVGFLELYGVGIIYGKYPDQLINQWDAWDEKHNSDNDRPDYFDDKQLYVVMIIEYGGLDLEHDVEPIVLWTPWFNDSRSWWEGYELQTLDGVNKCVITHYKKAKDEAHIAVFHKSDLDMNDLPPRRSNQLWVLYTAESLVELNESERLYALFNYSMNYRLDSNFPFVYYDTNIMEQLKKSPPSFLPNGEPVAWIASNCHAINLRHLYVKELMNYIEVANYGSCLNNKSPFPSYQTIEYIARHPFYLAIENSNCDDYVTEKLQNAFAAGVVPIVAGPRNYDPFLPTSHSAILLDDFPHPRDLALYLRSLIQNPKEYQKYVDFRYDPTLISEEFRRNWDGPNGWNRNIGLRRMCDVAWKLRMGEDVTLDDPEKEWIKPRILQKDTSCDGTVGKYAYVENIQNSKSFRAK